MIKIEELRLGNFVTTEDHKELFKTKDVDVIFSIEKGRVELFNDGNYGSASYFAWFDDEKINPIPITKKWLLKLGVKFFDLSKYDGPLENVVGNYIGGRKKFYYIIDSLTDGMGEYIYIDKEIQYIHQLQNIYFALTGEELTIK